MNKHPLKSKTVNSTLVIIIIACMSLLGIGEDEIGRTYDTISKQTGTTENAKELITIMAGAGAIYGRFKVKKGEEDE